MKKIRLCCSECGWEQTVKRLPPECVKELKQSVAIYCGRRICPSTDGITVPPGHIQVVFWFGSWSLVRPKTLEDYRAIKRARAIRDMAIRQMEEERK
jgi:hypothetical protein